ncbi:MAG: GAF domain-containing protein, partial [Nitrospirae bacterium]|nr:GAF domain-containing protein [Nitrospirota bacterium]
ILELHGGGLDLESKPGGEVRFLLTFDMTADRVVTRLSTKAFDLLNDLISEIMDVRISSIMMIDETNAELAIRTARGLDDETIRRTRLRLGDNIAGWVALEGRPLLIEDIEKDLVLKRTSIAQYETRSLLSVPIRAGDRVLGVLNVNNKEDGSIFNKIDMERASVLAERVARLAETLSGDPNPEFVSAAAEGLNHVLDAYRRYKTGHRRDMLPHLLPLLDALDLADDLRREIVFASLFHDMGLVTFPEQILRKPGAFTASEWEMMQTHPGTASDILGSLLATETGRGVIRHHHESFDGTGYPDGLRGEQIPIGARILSIVDAYTAMLTSRPYAPPRGSDGLVELLAYLRPRRPGLLLHAFPDSVDRLRTAEGVRHPRSVLVLQPGRKRHSSRLRHSPQ